MSVGRRFSRLFGGRRTLRWRVGLLASIGLLLLVGQLGAQAVAGGLAAQGGGELIRVSSMQSTMTALWSSIADERAAALLYVQTAEAIQLTEYTAERASADSNLNRLASLTGGTESSLVARLRADLGAWTTTTASMVGAPPAGDDLAARVVADDALYGQVDDSLTALAASLDRQAAAAGQLAEDAGLAAMATGIGISVLVAALLAVVAVRIIQLAVRPLVRLSAGARRIARGEPAHLGTTGVDEIQELARALHAWQATAAERELVAAQAPVGIVRVDLGGRVTSVNRAAELINGAPAGELVDRPLTDLIHPGDLARSREAMDDVVSGRRLSATLEARALRRDGHSTWCSVTIGRLLDADGTPVGTVGIIEDISERKRQVAQAMRIQRQLLPVAPPVLAGYEVAGECLPAQEVSGDLYDWTVGPAGHLDVTVADVMGKGIGAALLMSSLRTALRSAPAELGPAARLALAQRFMPLGTDEAETFITVFHARLDPRTGELRYVDAGHGYCEIRRRGGELVRLPRRSLPLGVMPDQPFLEGQAWLEPGDTLLAYSDGLVETGVASLDQRSFANEIAEAASASDMVRRILEPMPARRADDLTILVVRRLAQSTLARPA